MEVKDQYTSNGTFRNRYEFLCPLFK